MVRGLQLYRAQLTVILPSRGLFCETLCCDGLHCTGPSIENRLPATDLVHSQLHNGPVWPELWPEGGVVRAREGGGVRGDCIYIGRNVAKSPLLTTLPSPLPRSTTFPLLPLIYPSTRSICTGVAGTYGRAYLLKPGVTNGRASTIIPAPTPPIAQPTAKPTRRSFSLLAPSAGWSAIITIIPVKVKGQAFWRA